MSWVHDIETDEWWTAQCDDPHCDQTTDAPRVKEWTVVPPTGGRFYTLHYCPAHPT